MQDGNAGSGGEDAVGPLQHELARHGWQAGDRLADQLLWVDVALDQLDQVRHLLRRGNIGFLRFDIFSLADQLPQIDVAPD